MMYAFEAIGTLDVYSEVDGTRTTGVIHEYGGAVKALTTSLANPSVTADDDEEERHLTTSRWANATWNLSWSPSGPGWSIEADGRLKADIGVISLGTFTGMVYDDDPEYTPDSGIEVKIGKAGGVTATVGFLLDTFLGEATGRCGAGFGFNSHELGYELSDKLELNSNLTWIPPGEEHVESRQFGYGQANCWYGAPGSADQTQAGARLDGMARCDESGIFGIYTAKARIGTSGNISYLLWVPTYVSGSRNLNPDW